MAKSNPLIYLDSGATTLKPQKVISRMNDYYAAEVSNVHRGAHWFSFKATERFEVVRQLVTDFLGAKRPEEIIFTRGTTESINLVAYSYAENFLNEGDVIVLSELEHHSNIVPWQIIAKKKKLEIRFIPVLKSGELDLSKLDQIISGPVKIVSITGVSNVLGYRTPFEMIFKKAKALGAVTLLDAAQLVSIEKLNVSELPIDFLAFSGHKLFAPTGVGVLYGRYDLLDSMPPFMGGGSMIDQVSTSGVTFLSPPHRFEAGTPSIGDIMGLGAAIEWLNDLGYDWIRQHEKKLMSYLLGALQEVKDLKIIGDFANRENIVSMSLGNAHSSDVSTMLDEMGIAVRSGHHCCQPLMKALGTTGTVRASFSVYNETSDFDVLVKGLSKARELLL